MSTIIYEKITEELEVTLCCICAVRFGVPVTIMANRRNHAGGIYCPNGHYIGWKESESDRLRKELESKSRALTEAKCEAVNERRKREVIEATHAKHQRRTKNGVCPCCNRSFVNMQQHIKTKHPGYAK